MFAAFLARFFAAGVALALPVVLEAFFLVEGFLAVVFFEVFFFVVFFAVSVEDFVLAFLALGFVLVICVGVGVTPTSSTSRNATL